MPFNPLKNPRSARNEGSIMTRSTIQAGAALLDVIIATRNDGTVARIRPRHPAVLRRGNRANHGEP